MKEQNIKTEYPWVYIAGLIVALALWRAFVVDGSTHLLGNFTPIGAIALFAGAKLSNRKMRYIFPIAVLLASDILMSPSETSSGFLYSGWMWTYLAFIATVFFGERISKVVKFTTLFTASVASALCHWVLADFGVWVGGGINILTGMPFEKNLEGLLVCYSLGFPFFLKLAISTVIYSFVIFGLNGLISRTFEKKRLALE